MKKKRNEEKCAWKGRSDDWDYSRPDNYNCVSQQNKEQTSVKGNSHTTICEKVKGMNRNEHRKKEMTCDENRDNSKIGD